MGLNARSYDSLLIPRQLAPTPMMVFPVRIEHALEAAVQGSHDADPRPAPMTFIATKTTESGRLFSVVHAKWNGR
jgi:hypothetical protein